jgi:hypothetical protein
MFYAESGQLVAGSEARLARPDDDDVDVAGCGGTVGP